MPNVSDLARVVITTREVEVVQISVRPSSTRNEPNSCNFLPVGSLAQLCWKFKLEGSGCTCPNHLWRARRAARCPRSLMPHLG